MNNSNNPNIETVSIKSYLLDKNVYDIKQKNNCYKRCPKSKCCETIKKRRTDIIFKRNACKYVQVYYCNYLIKLTFIKIISIKDKILY